MHSNSINDIIDLTVVFPFYIPVYVPRAFWNFLWDALSALRVISPRGSRPRHSSVKSKNGRVSSFLRLRFPMNRLTGPLITVLFLLATLAIGREEVRGGTIGTNYIFPIDIMLFFGSLTYLAISIDASGLFRYVIFMILQRGGLVGHKLFFYLYIFFFGLATFVGSNPVILSSTLSLIYMTRISSNIVHPRAWIFTQFAISNIASAILVPSNPANLVLAGAFNIKFFHYTANTIVPVIFTAILLFPFLLYVIFADQALIPFSITLHELPDEVRDRIPVNPNIPHARGEVEEGEEGDTRVMMRSMEEIMNPFLDKGSALVGTIILVVALVVLIALDTTMSNRQHLAVWVTVPAAFAMLFWDITLGWLNRHETRELARRAREEIQAIRTEREMKEKAEQVALEQEGNAIPIGDSYSAHILDDVTHHPPSNRRPTLASFLRDKLHWCEETFPVATAVLSRLPISFVPFTLSMFVLIHALATKGWILVFAHGWDNWVTKTGPMGAIGGMSFLSVILSNVSLFYFLN